MKLPEPDLALAFEIAAGLGFEKQFMAELLPAGVQGIKDGINECNSEKTINQA